MPAKKNLLLADPFPLSRAGIVHTLVCESRWRRPTELDSIDGLFAAATAAKRPLALVHVEINGADVLEVVDRWRTACPSAPFVLYNGPSDGVLANHAVQRGAAGYLDRQADGDELLAALDAASRGEIYLSPRLDGAATADELPHNFLSDREYDVFLALCRGRRITDIAGNFDLSVKTISTYRSRVLRKLSLETNADLVRYAVQHRLIAAGNHR